MRLENVAVEAEEGGAAIAFGVDTLLESVERAFGKEGAGGAQGVGLKFLLEHGGEEFHERLPALEHDVANETVADDDVDVFGKDMEALDRPGVIDEVADAAEHVVGLGDEGVALALFRADGHQADAGGFDAEHDAAIMAAENGVVDEVLGFRVRVGARVDEDEVPSLARTDRGEGGAGDAFHHAEAESAAGHQRAGVAAADDNAGLAVFDQFDGTNHRGVFFLLQRLKRLVVHRHHLGGVKDGQPRLPGEARVVDQGAENSLVADQGDRADRVILVEGEFDCGYDLGGPEVTAHSINCDAPAGAGRGNHRGDGE